MYVKRGAKSERDTVDLSGDNQGGPDCCIEAGSGKTPLFVSCCENCTGH